MTIKVLLVDDETSFVEALGRRLTLRKLHVLTAGSADEALDILGREELDVVVLDVKMPGTDGLTAIKTIKRRHPLVEVILLSGPRSRTPSEERPSRKRRSATYRRSRHRHKTSRMRREDDRRSRFTTRSPAPLRGLRLSSFDSEVSTLKREHAAGCRASSAAADSW